MDKKQQKQSLVDAANEPMPTLNDMRGGVSNMADEAKRAVLQRLMQQGPPMPQSQNRSPEEDLALKIKGAQAMQQSKNQEANNVINRTQQDVQDADALSQFGDRDAADMASKKELLRKYLLNNR